MIIPSNWTTFSIVFYSIFGIFAVLLGFLDYYELLAMRYSKFGTAKGVPSRIAMVILYAFPLVVATVLAWPYLPNATSVQWVVYGAVMLHFTKRTLESAFVHKYSGNMQPLTFGIIVFTYALMAGMITGLNAQPLPAMDFWFYIGVVFVLVGEAGNFYHHTLLADLRSEDGEYHVPRGGWFNHATCPHYFFELLTWLGIALVSRHLFTWLIFIAMFGYLIARSIKTKQWYMKRFDDYPADRKFMLPNVF
jgi:hypothetical protein